jgi:hypothetical protein
MEQSIVEILDLPDEMLLTIANKLRSVDVLYSLVSVNERLDKLVRDTVFTHFLDLVATSSNDCTCSMSNVMLDRFCLHILPRIHNDVESLFLESLSMERILLAGDYPKLHTLTLGFLEPQVVLSCLAGTILLDPGRWAESLV